MPSFHQPAPARQSPHPATSKTVQHTTAAKAFGTLHLGALTEHIPVEMVREALTETGTHEQRTRRLSSARTVYFVLALALFPALGYLNVFAKLTAHAPLPAKISAAALTGARRRIGVKPLQLLFDLLRGPAPTVQREGSFHGRYRLCALDGTILTVADTVQNRLIYCKQPGLHGGTGYPQARLLALVACGTRSILDAVFGPTSIGETTYTPRLLRSMGEDMLVMADRNFASAALLHQIRQTGAQFLVRVKLGRNLPVHRVLPDGSYLSLLAGMPVRVLTANITLHPAGGQARTETYRLVTSMLDPAEGTAATLMGVYHQRWEVETAFRELKSTLLGGRVLRSKTVLLVEQEIYALLIVEQVLRTVMSEATNAVPGVDPDRASFTVALETARDTVLAGPPSATPVPLGTGDDSGWRVLAGMIGMQVLQRLLPPRRLRTGSRTVKRAISKYQARRSKPHTPTVVATVSIRIVDPGSLLTGEVAA